MLVTETGLDANPLTPEFADILGDGSGVLAEAVATNCELIEPAHFLGYLVKVPGTILHSEFIEIEPQHMNPQQFCDNLYAVGLPEERAPGVPLGFGVGSHSPASLRMLEAFEERMKTSKLERGTEELFVLLLLEHVDEAVRSLLVTAVGSEEGFERFHRTLEHRLAGPPRQPVFDDQTGDIVESAFDKSGRVVLNMLREETAGLGYRKATAMHLLYALVGIENGVVQKALQFQAIDPIREVHAYLSRQLARPAARRVADFRLTRACLHESVARTLEAAAQQAQRQVMRVGEAHIARALMVAGVGAVADFLASRKVDPGLLREYLKRTESEAEEATETVSLPIGDIESELRGRILGQDHAIHQILPWIKRLRFGFPRERGPAAVLLFLGPSGTGKTQLAKELARTVYGSEDALIMLEMGQFNSKESINLFIGAPPAYVGYGEGKLTNGLRDKPRSVVLFDEIEKAHEDVWVAVMRFLDEGLISDPAGPTRDGRQCIIVLTSNLGAATLAQRLPPASVGEPEPDAGLEQAIRDTILPYLKRPEIYNRVDDKVVFRAFIPEIYRRLVQRHVEVETRKFRDLRGTEVMVMPDVLEWLAERASEARQEGARCVPRIVTRFIVSPVIDLLTEDEEVPIPRVVVSKRGDGTGTVAEAA